MAAVSSAESMSMCKRHNNEEVRFYCKDCKALICDDCVIGDHKNHKAMKLKEYGSSRRTALFKFADVAESTTIQKILSAVKQATERRALYSESIAKEIDSLKSRRKLLDNLLDDLQSELTAEFTKSETNASESYDKFIARQELKIDKIKDIVGDIKSKRTELIDTEIAKYDVALEEILKHDPFSDTVPNIQPPRHECHEGDVSRKGKTKLQQLLGYIESETYAEVGPENIVLSKSNKTENSDKHFAENVTTDIQPYLEPVFANNQVYLGLGKRHCFHTVCSFEIENSITHIVPKEVGRLKAWILDTHVTEVDCSGNFDHNLIKVLDQNLVDACTNQNNELLLAFQNKSSFKALTSNRKSYTLGSSFSGSSGKHIVFSICRSSTSGIDNIACLQEKSKSGNYSLRSYVNGKSKSPDIILSSVDVENPVQICDNSDGDICITCRPGEKPSWITVVDRNGRRKIRYPSTDSKVSTEEYDFVGAGFLSNKMITISNRGKREQVLINSDGQQVQADKLKDKPVCCSVDRFDNVWIGFANGKFSVTSYKQNENEYAEVRPEAETNTKF